MCRVRRQLSNAQMVRAMPEKNDGNRQSSFLALFETGDVIKTVRFYHHQRDGNVFRIGFQLAAFWTYPGPIHDVAYIPFSHRLVCAPGRRLDSKPLRPCWMDIGQPLSEQQLEFSNTPSNAAAFAGRFPQSDALCIEPDPNHPNVVAFGHRNGQVSWVDFRTSRACEITTSAPCDSQGVQVFGSITSLIIPNRDPYWILAQGSMGVTRLFDVRCCTSKNLSSPCKPSRGTHTDHVIEFSIPPEFIHPTLTSRCCNGMALDPTGEVIAAPYINHKEGPCFGLWSLRSGSLISTKHISANSTGDPQLQQHSWTNTLPYCELRSTPTRGWSWNARGDGDDEEAEHEKTNDESMIVSDFQIDQPAGRWGLWFKFGRPLVQRKGGNSLPPCRTGSIHHVSFHGRPSETLPSM